MGDLCAAPVPVDIEPHHGLWMAALELLLEDARDYLVKAPDRAGVREAAYRDVTDCGPMLRRVCRFALLDPEDVRRLFLKGLRPVETRSTLTPP